MSQRVVVLGAGFGGLELTTVMSEALGANADITLIDKSDAFVFGYSKFDIMFGKRTPEAARLPYAKFAKPGVRLLRETITAIDPVRKVVTTNAGVHEADTLVLALGADYDWAAVPGITAGVNEFYSVPGAEAMRDILPGFRKGHAVIGVCDAPFKCPPAPSECTLLLDEYLERRGVRQDCTITLVLPLGSPIPPSPATSQAILAEFGRKHIRFIPGTCVTAVDTAKKTVTLDHGDSLPYDLFLGVPKHHAPAVVRKSGLADGDWVPVNPKTLETKFRGVYAVGDIANQGTPKAGVFAERAAKAVAETLVAQIRNAGVPGVHSGTGSCYIEFGGDRVARVDVDFFSAKSPTGTFQEATTARRAEKDLFGSSRRARGFGG